jgi:hypothetical protein
LVGDWTKLTTIAETHSNYIHNFSVKFVSDLIAAAAENPPKTTIETFSYKFVRELFQLIAVVGGVNIRVDCNRKKKILGCRLFGNEFALLTCEVTQCDDSTTFRSTSNGGLTFTGLLLNEIHTPIGPLELAKTDIQKILRARQIVIDVAALFSEQGLAEEILAVVLNYCAASMVVSKNSKTAVQKNLESFAEDDFILSIDWEHIHNLETVNTHAIGRIGCRTSDGYFTLLHAVYLNESEAVQLHGIRFCTGQNFTSGLKKRENVTDNEKSFKLISGLLPAEAWKFAVKLHLHGDQNYGESLQLDAGALEDVARCCVLEMVVDSGSRLAFRDSFLSMMKLWQDKIESTTNEVPSVGCKIGSGEMILLHGKVVEEPESGAQLCLDGIVLTGSSAYEGRRIRPSYFSLSELETSFREKGLSEMGKIPWEKEAVQIAMRFYAPSLSLCTKKGQLALSLMGVTTRVSFGCRLHGGKFALLTCRVRVETNSNDNKTFHSTNEESLNIMGLLLGSSASEGHTTITPFDLMREDMKRILQANRIMDIDEEPFFSEKGVSKDVLQAIVNLCATSMAIIEFQPVDLKQIQRMESPSLYSSIVIDWEHVLHMEEDWKKTPKLNRIGTSLDRTTAKKKKSALFCFHV